MRLITLVVWFVFESIAEIYCWLMGYDDEDQEA